MTDEEGIGVCDATRSETRSPNCAPESNGRFRPRLSSKARAFLVLQGRYIGSLRQLNPTQKAQVRKIRDTKGVRTASPPSIPLSGGPLVPQVKWRR